MCTRMIDDHDFEEKSSWSQSSENSFYTITANNKKWLKVSSI